MASLANQTISSTYDGLIKTSTDQPVGVSGVQLLEDGVGNTLALSVGRANQGVTVTGTLTATALSGPLTGNVTGDLTGDVTGNVTGDVTGDLTGDVLTAAQTNITSVGTLSSLAVSGDVSIADKIVHTGDTNTAIRFPAADTIAFETSGTEKVRITSSGSLGIGNAASNAKLEVSTSSGEVFRADAAAGNPKIVAEQSNVILNGINGNVGIGTFSPAVELDVDGEIRASDGILFGSDTAAANALDDYEEGTWTMGVEFGGASAGITYAEDTGTYTKIGRQVTVNGYLTLTSKGSSVGSATITGLPFTIPNSNSNYSAVSLWFSNITFANQFIAIGTINTTTISLQESTILGVNTPITDADFANDSQVIVSLTYFV
jgi:hypothetical protein